MRATGEQWERRAERWLSRRGLQLVERNYTIRGGEIDLVMRDSITLVFVEVKYRQRDDFGSGAEVITTTKQQRVIRAAKHYLSRHPHLIERPCRFDVISIQGGIIPRYDWIQDAFPSDE